MHKKTILVTLSFLIVLVLLSGYIENKYCHYWSSHELPGVSVDYRKINGFCDMNKYTGALGGWLISFIN